MTVTQYKHLVVFATYFWGHSRPMSTLVARIVKLRPVMVTFLTLVSLHGRVQEEIARDFQPGEEHLASRIRIVALKDGSVENAETSGAPGAFQTAWNSLCSDEPLICAKTGVRFEALPIRPSAALVDFFAPDAYDVVHKTSRGVVKAYTWFAAATHSLFQVFGEDKYSVALAEAMRSGRPFNDVAIEYMWAINGGLAHSPCLPSMYDYEMHPQEVLLTKELIGNVIIKIHHTLMTADGLVTFDAADYFPEATAAIRSFYGEKSRNAFYAGPLLPSGVQAASKEQVLAQNGGEVMAFLDEKLKSVGERSVLYLSFGSLFWPADHAKLWAVIEVLMEKNVPFVMSHGAAMASPIPDDLRARIDRYGNAIISDWVPQQALLDHPATGWYLMHGGHNGTIEAVTAGVPMIVWPIDADQPMNAVYLSEMANVAYELVEVRHGRGLGRIFRNGRTPTGTVDAVKEEMREVLDRAYGADGAEKRARLQAMRKKLQAAWGEDGVARRELAAFLDDF